MHNIKSFIFLKKFLTGFEKKRVKEQKNMSVSQPTCLSIKKLCVCWCVCVSQCVPVQPHAWVSVYLPICLDLLAISLVEQWSLHMGSAGQICILLKNWSNSFMGKENPKKVALCSFAAHLRSTGSNPFKAWIFSPLFCNCNAAHLLRS